MEERVFSLSNDFNQIADVGTNSITISGPREQMAEWEKVIHEADVLYSKELRVHDTRSREVKVDARLGSLIDPPLGPRVVAAHDTSVLCCWFVEDNGWGRSGYVAVDGRRGHQPPEGGGLFGTVHELREAIKRQKVDKAEIVPSFGGRVPENWKIRDLTDDEVRILTSEK